MEHGERLKEARRALMRRVADLARLDAGRVVPDSEDALTERAALVSEISKLEEEIRPFSGSRAGPELLPSVARVRELPEILTAARIARGMT
ncbi:MAG: hypothetical protein BGP17_07740 [Sphingomonas sp. 67-41]|nr:MAG: hypothetical protein BGP17_07740 [Sphingomonas sp. 67-41]